MPVVPTVKIKHDQGFCIINESDFDPKVHELFDKKEEPVEKTPGESDYASLTKNELQDLIEESTGDRPKPALNKSALIEIIDGLK